MRTRNPFIDDEAANEEDHIESEEEELTSPEDFIDDNEGDTSVDEGVPGQGSISYQEWASHDGRTESRWHSFLQRWDVEPGTRPGALPLPQAATLGPVLNVLAEAAAKPTPDDYPLWRMPCRSGLEEQVVFEIMKLSLQTDNHSIRSAHTSGHERGHVFVEGLMNENTLKLLGKVRGLKKRATGPMVPQASNAIPYSPDNARDLKEQYTGLKIPRVSGQALRQGRLLYKIVDVAEAHKTLKCTTAGQPQRFDYCTIKKGYYQGDAGIVEGVDEGRVEILLVPRLKPSLQPDPTNKRKRSTQRGHQRLHGDVHREVGVRYENGLIRKLYGPKDIGVAHSIRLDNLMLFQQSTHPAVAMASFPKPLEWQFKEDDLVVWGSSRMGIVRSFDHRALEVEDEEGPKVVAWAEVLKHFELGDHVVIDHGQNRGQEGFIDQVEDNMVGVVVVGTGGSMQGHFKGHRNIVSRRARDFHHKQKGKGKAVPTFVDEELNTFIGQEVVVSKLGHPYRTAVGIVQEAIDHPEPKGLHLILAVERAINAAMSTRTIIVDAKAVIHKRTQQPLQHEETRAYLNLPPEEKNKVYPLSPSIDSGPSTETRCATPLPESNVDAPEGSAWSLSDLILVPRHPLLSARWEGTKFSVTINGGPYTKTATQITVKNVNGTLSLVHQRRPGAPEGVIDPNWVHIKHPNPKGSNAVLAVVQGEHEGKVGFRVDFKELQTDRYALELAILKTREAPWTLSDERVLVHVQDMCELAERPREKKKDKMDFLARLRHPNAYRKFT